MKLRQAEKIARSVRQWNLPFVRAYRRFRYIAPNCQPVGQYRGDQVTRALRRLA